MPITPLAVSSLAVSNKRKILVVDDDHDFAEGLAELLESEGYEVSIATNAADAERTIKEFPAEAGLIDIRLGHNSGINLIVGLRNIRPETLFVLMTAFASADTAIAALQKSAYDYLSKPFSAGGSAYHSQTSVRTFGSRA